MSIMQTYCMLFWLLLVLDGLGLRHTIRIHPDPFREHLPILNVRGYLFDHSMNRLLMALIG